MRKANGIISRLRHYTPTSILISVYHPLFFSQFSSSQNLNRVSKLQNTALRLITFSNFRHPHKPLLHRFNLLSVFDFIKLQNLTLIFQILHEIPPKNICNTFSLEHISSGYPTRGSQLRLLTRPRIRTTVFGINSIRYQCILNWNTFQIKFPKHDLTSISLLNELKSLAKSSYLKLYISN